MTSPQGSLFPEPAKKRVWRMHVSDASNEGRATVQLTCRRCGYESDWIAFDTVTEAKRGLPCPCCNADPAAIVRPLFK